MRLIFVILLNLVVLACATRYSASDSYHELLEHENKTTKNSRTVLFFLIDGLPMKTLKSGLAEGSLPNLKNHFLKKNAILHEAYSAFPSLTFTNIAGLISEKPVHLSGAYGNTILQKGNFIRFENLADRAKFAGTLQDHNLFKRLTEQGNKSVSFDYGLGADATVSSEFTDLKVGLAAGLRDYLYLDQKRIDSLDQLLQTTKPEKWPSFIFIHLIGVDFLSHQLGPEAPAVKNYLSLLDRRLARVLKRIEKMDQTAHQMISMLSADHGFAFGIKHRVPIEAVVRGMDPKALVLNEGRMAGIFSQDSPSRLAKKLVTHPLIEVAASYENNQLTVQSKNKKITFLLVENSSCHPISLAIAISDKNSVCPELLTKNQQDLFYPHFILNLIYYFQAPNHPDLAIIPTAHTSFSFHDVGVHGGPTADETTVPVLLRNATFPSSVDKPAIWQLLQFI